MPSTDVGHNNDQLNPFAMRAEHPNSTAYHKSSLNAYLAFKTIGMHDNFHDKGSKLSLRALHFTQDF